MSGYLFDEESEAIAAVRELLGSPERRVAMGKRARAKALLHSWQAATELLLEHYRTACEKQIIAYSDADAHVRHTMASRTKKALGRTFLLAARKLLP
jgi:hypothetical protein